MEENKMETMEKEKTVHRIGTASFGVLLIFFGILFLVHMFVPGLTYEWIFRLWPVLFISLGIEVLLGCLSPREKWVYDGLAMVLMILLTLFAMGMAAIDLAIQYAAYGGVIHL